MAELGIGTIYLVGLALAAGYLYLWFYNTEMALRITFGFFRMMSVVFVALGRAVYALFSFIYRLIAGGKR